MKSMVYKNLSIVLVVAVGMMITIASHKQESQKKREIFDRNAAAVKALFQVFADRNLNARMDLLANDARYSPAQYYGNVLLDKEEMKEVFNFFHDNFKAAIFHEGVGLTSEKSNVFLAAQFIHKMTIQMLSLSIAHGCQLT